MTYAFIIIGGIFFGIGLAGLLGTKSRVLKPKYLRTDKSRYYTFGQLAMIRFKSWWKGKKDDKPKPFYFADHDLRTSPHHDDTEKTDKSGENPLP